MPMHPGRAFRHWLVFLSALALAGLTTASWLVGRGAETSLRLAEERLGADILVMPAGGAPSVEAALLVGGPVYASMPEDNVQRIAALAGVAAVSPQLYLYSPPESQPPQPALLLVACDPAGDPALRPWLSGPAPGSLALGSAVGGARVTLAAGEDVLWLYGSPLRLAGSLPPTGTNLDRCLFVSLETAHLVARQSYALAPRPLELPLTGISAALVRVRPASDPIAVAREMEAALPGVSAVLPADLFAGFRSRIAALRLRLLLGLAVAAAALAIPLLLTYRAALRAQASRGLAAQAAASAVSGLAFGLALAAPATSLLCDALVAALGLPVQLPPLTSLLALSTGSLACATIVLAALGRAARVEGAPGRMSHAGSGPTSG